MGGVAESHHKGQLLRLLDAQQRGQGGLIDRAHDAAAHALVPCGKGHVGQCNAGVGGKVAGNGGILHHSCIKGGQLVRLGRALLRRQIAGPFFQRLYLGHHLRALHQHQTHRLPVCPAGGQSHGLYDIVHHILRHGLLCKPAVSAAGSQKLHCIHRDHSFI